jgi:hypothetical protein
MACGQISRGKSFGTNSTHFQSHPDRNRITLEWCAAQKQKERFWMVAGCYKQDTPLGFNRSRWAIVLFLPVRKSKGS